MSTKRAARCPRTKLTHLQIQCLALATTRSLPDPRELPAVAGVRKSLVARGLLTSKYDLTDDGRSALECTFLLSPNMRWLLSRKK